MKIRHKITLWVAGAGFLTSFVFSSVVFLEMREQPLQLLDSQLEMTSDALAKQMSKEPRLLEAKTPNKLIIIQGKRYWVKIYDSALCPVYQSELSTVVDLPLYQDKVNDAYTVSARISKHSVYLRQDGNDEVTFRVRATKAKVGDASYLIQVAKPVEKLEEETFDLLTAVGIGMAVSTVILLCISYFIAGHILKPIASINRLATKINEKTLGQRVPLGKSHDEIFELSTCLNSMFDRLEFSFAKQKQYLADASHELKSPIAMLRLFFEEATQSRDVSDTWRDKLIRQEHNLLRMDRLVKTLLELSAIEVGEPLNVEFFCLTDLLRSVLDDFAPLLGKANIHLETELPQSLNMHGDQDKVRRAFINLLDNAIKYNVENGRIKLHVTAKSGFINLSLYNTGPGIPANEREKVFEQFYRVEKSRAAQYGGAGLGLTIVREIIRLHHGAVSIDSAPGKWMRVKITLPQHHDLFPKRSKL